MSTYLLRTKPQGERKAIDSLTRIGHPAWTPTEERVLRASRHAKRKRIVRYPLAPRYVVAEADNPHLLAHEIDEVSGVVGALRTPDVARLRAMDSTRAETTIGKALAVGQHVRVRSGPFIDHPGVIETILDDTATINVQIFGRPTPATMPLEYLDPV